MNSRENRSPAGAARIFGLVLSLCAGGAPGAEPDRVCELATKHRGLVQYALRVDADAQGNRTAKADVDLDGKDDVLRWFDGGSASIIPADLATLSLTLASDNQTFTLQQERLYVVKYESRYYVVTTRAETQLGPWYREVYSLGGEGIRQICSFEGKGQIP